MLLRDIFSCVTLDDAIATTRAAWLGALRQSCRGTHSRVRISGLGCDCPFFLSCILTLFACCAPFLLSGCLGGQIIGANASAGSLQASPTNVSFGSVPLGTTTSASVSVVNPGSAAVQVSQVSLAGQSFTVSGAGDLPITVAAGHTLNLSVSFSPAATGMATGELTIGSSAAANGTLVVGLSGTGATAVTPNPAQLSSLSCVDASATGPTSDTCTVALSTAATSGGFAVSLTSDNAAVSLPASVTVAEGSTAVSFTASVSAVSAMESATLTASAGGVAETFALQLNAASQVGTGTPELSGLRCGSSSIIGTETDSCTVTLSAPAASGGFAVGLTSSNSAVSVPASVTVAAGATTGSFTATIAAVGTAQTVTLTASAGGVAETFTLQVNADGQLGIHAPELSGLSCDSSTVMGAGTDICTITLSAVAASGGFAVGLTSNNSAVSVPASVTVASGSTTSSFTATVADVSTAQTATLTASAGGVVETFALQLSVSVPELNISATSVTFGDVQVNTTMTQSVELGASGALPVVVAAATIQGTGFSIAGAAFPITLAAGQTVTVDVTFDPTTAGATTGQLIIASTAIASGTSVISLSGTGVLEEVNLTWNAPGSSPDPVAGYNVYRAPSGSSSYQQLNSSVVTQTTYVDLSVGSGQTYDYIVESVDASGVTSTPSNTASVTLP